MSRGKLEAEGPSLGKRRPLDSDDGELKQNRSYPKPHMSSVGTAIKRARTGKLSIDALAVKAGVSSGLISQLERGRGNPSLLTLRKIAGALGISVGDLLPASSEVDPILIRREERNRLEVAGSTMDLLTPLRRKLVCTRRILPSGYSSDGGLYQTGIEILIFVLIGEIEVRVGDTTHSLREGDSMYYDATLPTLLTNRSPAVAEIFACAAPPGI